MKKFTLYLLLLLVLITLVSLLIFNAFQQIPKEGFSEIYFDDFNEIPTSIKLNEPLKFSFIVINKEANEENYDYIVMIKYKSKQDIIDSGSFSLKNNEINIIEETILVKEDFNLAIVSVKLLNKNQEIHFWVRQDVS